MSMSEAWCNVDFRRLLVGKYVNMLGRSIFIIEIDF